MIQCRSRPCQAAVLDWNVRWSSKFLLHFWVSVHWIAGRKPNGLNFHYNSLPEKVGHPVLQPLYYGWAWSSIWSERRFTCAWKHAMISRQTSLKTITTSQWPRKKESKIHEKNKNKFRKVLLKKNNLWYDQINLWIWSTRKSSTKTHVSKILHCYYYRQ